MTSGSSSMLMTGCRPRTRGHLADPKFALGKLEPMSRNLGPGPRLPAEAFVAALEGPAGPPGRRDVPGLSSVAPSSSSPGRRRSGPCPAEEVVVHAPAVCGLVVSTAPARRRRPAGHCRRSQRQPRKFPGRSRIPMPCGGLGAETRPGLNLCGHGSRAAAWHLGVVPRGAALRPRSDAVTSRSPRSPRDPLLETRTCGSKPSDQLLPRWVTLTQGRDEVPSPGAGRRPTQRLPRPKASVRLTRPVTLALPRLPARSRRIILIGLVDWLAPHAGVAAVSGRGPTGRSRRRGPPRHAPAATFGAQARRTTPASSPHSDVAGPAFGGDLSWRRNSRTTG